MQRYFVDYMAYLSYLMQLPENVGLGEEEVYEKYKMKGNVYTLSFVTPMDNPFKDTCENVFQVRPFTYNGKYISNFTEDKKRKIVIEVSEEQLMSIEVPYNYIYSLSSIIKGYLYRQKAYNMYIMDRLNTYELQSIDDDNMVYYYNKFAQGILYAKEEKEDGSITLTKIYPQKELDKIPNLCYICDSNFPEGMEEIITYLKGRSPEHFIKEELHERNHKNFFERIYRKKD